MLPNAIMPSKSFHYFQHNHLKIPICKISPQSSSSIHKSLLLGICICHVTILQFYHKKCHIVTLKSPHWHHDRGPEMVFLQIFLVTCPCVDPGPGDTLHWLTLSSCVCVVTTHPVLCDHPTLDFLSPAHPTPPCCFFSMVSPTMLMIYASSSIRIVKPTLDFLLPCFPCSVVWCVLSPLAMVLPPPLVTIVSSPRSSSVLTGILSRHRGSSHVMSLLASVTCLPSS